MKKTRLYAACAAIGLLTVLLTCAGVLIYRNHQKIRQLADELSQIQAEKEKVSPDPQKVISAIIQKEPNMSEVRSSRLSPNTLEIIQNALRQVQRQKYILRNDANQIALLSEENERLKQELAQIKSTIQLQQTGNTVATDLQTKKSAAEEAVVMVVEELRSNPDSVQKCKLLESLSGPAENQDLALLSIIQQGILDSDTDVQSAALDLLDHYHGTEAVPLLSLVLNAEDAAVRLAAVQQFEDIAVPEASELYIKAIDDQDNMVRASALSGIEKQPDAIQFAVYENGVISDYPDVKRETLSLLQFRGSPECVDIAMQGLKDSDPEFVQQVNSTLSFLIDREFQSYEEAKTWWLSNKDHYDENLILK